MPVLTVVLKDHLGRRLLLNNLSASIVARMDSEGNLAYSSSQRRLDLTVTKEWREFFEAPNHPGCAWLHLYWKVWVRLGLILLSRLKYEGSCYTLVQYVEHVANEEGNPYKVPLPDVVHMTLQVTRKGRGCVWVEGLLFDEEKISLGIDTSFLYGFKAKFTIDQL